MYFMDIQITALSPVAHTTFLAGKEEQRCLDIVSHADVLGRMVEMFADILCIYSLLGVTNPKTPISTVSKV